MSEAAVRILLVEDDPDDYYLTRELLTEIPGGEFTLEWAANYDAGLAAIARDEHDAYLLDYRLGSKTGLQLLHEAIARGCKAPAILLTGAGDRELAMQALDAGASDFLVKGQIDAAALERTIRYALQQKRYADQLEQKVQERTAELERANAELTASQERYRLLIEGATGFAIMMLDLEGRVATWNVGAQRLLGYEDAEVLGQYFGIFFPSEAAAAGLPERELAAAAKHELGEDDNWLVRKDGTRFCASGATTALRDDLGNLRGFAKVVRDVTDRKQLEDALRQLAASLSEANRRKDEFLATLAHELRNPLAPIRTGLEVMRMSPDFPPDLEEIRAVMERQTQQLVTLIDDLLDISRITQGKMELRPARVVLSEVVQNALEASAPIILEAGHEVSVSLPEQPVLLQADPHRLAQVLSNLLNNAAKYTPQGGHIWLKATRRDDDVLISVKDNGLGIPPDMLGRVFEMFTQVDRQIEHGYTGLGIGLTLVKRIVEMHGGTVSAASDGPNQGSEFTIRLAALDEQADLETAESRNRGLAARSAQRRVLLVDDNEDGLKLLSVMVGLLGHEVRTASDGVEAIQAVQEFQPHLVLMDLGMPKMNGYEAAKRIRQLPQGRQLTLVAITGWGQEQDKERTKEAGFDRHLVKPVDPAALEALLGRAKAP